MWNVLAGIAGGAGFHYLWRRILPARLSRAFWRALPAHAAAMVRSADSDDVLRHYGLMMRDTARFAARNTIAVVAGLVPLGALFVVSGGLHASERRAALVEVRPAHAVARLPASATWAPTPGGGLEFDRSDYEQLRLFGRALDREALADKTAFCDGWMSCLGYGLMLFETHQLPDTARTVVVRPRIFDGNPWWPYLDDLELAFFAGAAAGALGAGWAASRAKGAT
jgi:hypothetical protein